MPARKPILSAIEGVRLLSLEPYVSHKGSLGVLEENRNIPFPILRVFYIWGVPNGMQRGYHAHRRCEQFLICLNGSCNVVCRDSKSHVEYQLSRPDMGLYIPAGIWTEQTYEDDKTVLIVLADQPYDEADYIRDYSAFIRCRNEMNKEE